jgi:hypothetical protein
VVQASILEYHRSISKELESTRNRIRHLLGDAHWPTEGEYKEAILRRALRTYLPGTLRVGRGFVSYPNHRSSTQIDVLITDTRYPTLFQEGDTVIVTPEAVRAIIEVKTTLRTPGDFGKVICTLGRAVADIREAGNTQCQAGLFVYEKSNVPDSGLLRHLALQAERDDRRAVNWVAFGPNRFFRFWEHGLRQAGSPIDGPVWHAYGLMGLAYSYFLSNVVWELTMQDLRQQGRYVPGSTEQMWFPLEEDGGKENYRKSYVPLAHGDPQKFV